MNDAELQQLVEQISISSFHRPFKHVAYFNSRLRSTGGRFHLNDGHIDINPKMLTDFGRATLIGVIKHELCHYHLYWQHLGYQHQNAEFKQLLQQVGGLRYAPAPRKRSINHHRYLYVCQRCGQTYPRQRRMNTQKYACGRCHGVLKLVASASR